MPSVSVEQRFRRFLLGVTAAIFVGTALELILVDHTEEALQWIPFILSGIGLMAVVAAWKTHGAAALKALRFIMIVVALGSLLGVWLHFHGNYEFTREINPSFSAAESIWPALKGSNPLVAPGILFLAGVLGYAATWRHPALQE